MNKILILTNSKDAHADYCSKKMKKRAIHSIRFNTEHFPNKVKVVWNSGSPGESRAEVYKNSGKILFNADEIKSVWFRKVMLDEFGYLAARTRDFASRENDAFFNNLYASMRDRRWVNFPLANRFADNKMLQLNLAKKLGFIVPDTLVTNNTAAAREFFKKYERQGVVYKTLKMPFVRETKNSFISVYTSRLDWSSKIAKSIGAVPCIFQEYIEKAYELRVTVVGDQIFAARIFSQEHQDSKIDWRRNQHKTNLRHEVEYLDLKTQDRCFSIVRELQLLFGAIDMIVTPDGRYVFLEINPNGQWLWLEQRLGLPIADALIDLLLLR